MVGIVIAIFFGWAGGYRFYKKQIKLGIIYLFTFGLFGMGWVWDIIVSIDDLFKKNKQEHHKAQIDTSEFSVTKPDVSLYKDDHLKEDAEKSAPLKESRSLNENVSITYSPLSHVLNGHVCQYDYEKVDFFSLCNQKYEINSLLSIEQEPENEHDPNAVALFLNHEKIGYMYRNKLQEMANDYLNCGDIVLAKIDSEKTFHLYFYKHISKLSGYNSKIFTLTGLSKKDDFGNTMEENLEQCEDGDSIDLNYDLSVDKYIATSNSCDEIGELSSSQSNELYNMTNGQPVIAIVENVLNHKIIVYYKQ